MFETLAEISPDDLSTVELASMPSSQNISKVCHFRITRGQSRGLSRY